MTGYNMIVLQLLLLIPLVLEPSSANDLPAATIPSSTILASTGEPVTLLCVVTNVLDITSVKWTKAHHGITQDNISWGNSRYIGGTISSPSLSINNVAHSDEGYYTCTVTNTQGTSLSQQIYLYITQNLFRVSITYDTYVVAVGEFIILQCTVTSGTPVTSVKWTKTHNGRTQYVATSGNSKYSGGTINSPSLSITNADYSDMGYYICWATNTEGTTSSQQTFLDVSGSIPTVITHDPEYNVTMGRQITLVCTITSTPPHTHVKWDKTVNKVPTDVVIDGSKYTGSTVNSPSLTIHRVDRSDIGCYACYGTNSVGTGQSHAVSLVVHVAGNIPIVVTQQAHYSVTMGNDMTLVCTINSTPSYTEVKWVKTVNNVPRDIVIDGTKYIGSTVNSPSLTIHRIDTSDVGYYTCYGTNIVGTGQSQEVHLDVVGSIPIAVTQQTHYSVAMGSDVTLICTITSTPSYTQVKWGKRMHGIPTDVVIDGNKYSGSTVNSPSLTIHSADSSDVGYYTCYGSNRVGTGQSREVHLDVVGSIPIAVTQQTHYSATMGSDVTLICTITSTPSYTHVKWGKRMHGIPTDVVIDGNKYTGSTVNSPSLTIHSADSSDVGYYTCYGSNRLGTGQSREVHLDVVGSIPTAVAYQPQSSVAMGRQITLVCTITSTPPHTHVKWVKAMNNLPRDIVIDGTKYSGSTVISPSLTIHRIDSSDVGYYTCYGTNRVGTGQSQEVHLDVVGNLPVVTIPFNTYEVTVGGFIIIQCTISSDLAVTTVQWTKTLNGQTQIILIHGNFRYTGGTISSPSLGITQATLDDEGSYTCSATNFMGTTSSQQTFLYISGSVPIAVTYQAHYSVTMGNDVTLVCTITSTPSYTQVKWGKGMHGIPTDVVIDGNKYTGSTVNSPSLTIHSADSSDVGYYTCYGSNRVGTGQSQEVHLDVVGYIPQVHVISNSYTVTLGNKVSLQCVISADPRYTNVYWKKTVNSVSSYVDVNSNRYGGATLSSPSLEIYNTVTSDEGFYVCYAANSVGTGHSAQTYLDVVGNVPVVNVPRSIYRANFGSDITLDCHVTSNPFHTSVYWERIINDHMIEITTNSAKYGGSTVNNPSLTIYSFTANDIGSYKCLAVNSISTGESQLTVLGVIGHIPTVKASVRPLVAYGDHVVVINCLVIADPKETAIIWKKVIDDVPTALSIPSNRKYNGGTVDTPSLTMADVVDTDSGYYICEATNPVGAGSSNKVYLDVVGEAPHRTYMRPNSRQVVIEGSPISARCVTTSNPNSTFTWHKDNDQQVLVTGNILKIESSTKNDHGVYICRASNVYGYEEVSLTVDVQYKPELTISSTTTIFSAVIDDSIKMPCSYIANPNATEVKWKKIVENVSNTILTIDGYKYVGGLLHQSDLYIYSLDASDNGFYQCLATNQVGTGESNIVQLIVDTQTAPYDLSIQPAYIDIEMGSAIEATCMTKGDPVSTFVWYFKDQKVGTGPQLSIPESTSMDDGLYTCIATNPFGILQDTVNVNVKYAPVVTTNKTKLETLVNHPVTLTCYTRANPSATEWTWTKDGSMLLDYYSETYLVDMDSLQDLGTYTCIARNTVGRSSAIEFHVKQAKPRKFYTIEEKYILSAGEIAAITVGILLPIFVTAVIVICCLKDGCCKKYEYAEKDDPKPFVEEPVDESDFDRGPIFMMDWPSQLIFRKLNHPGQLPECQFQHAIKFKMEHDERNVITPNKMEHDIRNFIITPNKMEHDKRKFITSDQMEK